MRKTLAACLIAGVLFAYQALAQTLTPFYPTGNGTLSVSATSSSVALPTIAPTAWICNTGGNTAFLQLGNSTTAATTSSFSLPAGLCVQLATTGSTYLAAITSTGATTLTISTGNGTISPGSLVPVSATGAGGAITTVPADAVNFNNTTLTNGTVTNGLFSSGTVTNPTSNQVILGPIDTAGAQSGSFYVAVSSGSGSTLTMQESNNAAGPWSTVTLSTFTSSYNQYNNFPYLSNNQNNSFRISSRYIQVIASAATEVLSVSGYLRSNVFSSPAVEENGYVSTNIGQGSPGASYPITLTSSRYQVISPYSIPEVTWQYSTAGTPITTNTTTTLDASCGTGMRNYLTGLKLVNSNTTATEIQILDGSTVIYDDYLASDALTSGVISVTFPVPLRGSAATAMSLKTLTTGASIYASAQGYCAY